MAAAETFVGIDVSKAHLDVAIRHEDGRGVRVGTTGEGIAELVTRLRGLAPHLVVVEATGGLERVPVAELAAGLPIVVINPRQARDFAKATRRLAKTDALDAAALAHYGEAIRPEPRPLPDAEARALDALAARCRQLVGMATAEKIRLASATAPRVRAGIAEHIAWLEARVGELDGELDRRIR